MSPLVLLGILGGVAIAGSLFGLVNDDDAEETLTDIDESEGYDLLDQAVIDSLSEGALAGIESGVDVIDADAVRGDYAPTGPVEIEGTDSDDYILAGEDVEVTFGADGDDTVIGADHPQVIFGDGGDDVLLGEGGDDYVQGDTGADTLSGGSGGDLMVGGEGADAIYGGEGDDSIYTADVFPTESNPNEFDVVNAGAGADQVFVTQGASLIELGEGEDDILIYSDFSDIGEDPLAIITDFDVAEDQIVLGVNAPDFDLEAGTNALEITYSLSQIETSQGMATLVVPAVEEEALFDALQDASVGYVVLIGVTPDQIGASNIRAFVTSDDSNATASDSIQNIFESQSVGASI